MAADPSPVPDADGKALRDFADELARSLGYLDWIEAYHATATTAALTVMVIR